MPPVITRTVQDAASTDYPSVRLPTGERLHVFHGEGGGWQVWLNTPLKDFDGICIGSGVTAEQAIAEAIDVLEAARAMLCTWPRRLVSRGTSETSPKV